MWGIILFLFFRFVVVLVFDWVAAHERSVLVVERLELLDDAVALLDVGVALREP